MLFCNPQKMFELRGIKKPLTFMTQNGFSYNVAWRYFNGQVTRIDLTHIETLCIHLNCTPNDIIEWHPDKTVPENPAHPLQSLRPKTDNPTITQLLSDFPTDKVDELADAIRHLKNSSDK